MSGTRQQHLGRVDGSAADPAPGHPGAAPAREPVRRARRLPQAAAAGLGVLCLAAAGTTAYALTRDDAGGDPTGAGLPAATTEVARGTLTDATTEGGTLGYGTSRAVTPRRPGTITWLPSTGDVVGRGEQVLEIDSRPVLLLFGVEPVWRDLHEGLEGRDVRQLERNLRALGYDGFDVDQEFTSFTEVAVLEWQADLGLDETGVVTAADIVFHPGPVRVESLVAGLGDVVAEGAASPALSVTGTAPAATVALDPSDRRLAEVGSRVEVTLPDGSTVAATVTEAATQVEEGDGGQPEQADATTTLEVVAELAGKDAVRRARAYDAAAVDVTFTAGERTDVLIVPVAALVALAEGGFGLEVVEDGTSRYVPVDAGLFSGGRVEVSGAGITEGTVVGLPQ